MHIANITAASLDGALEPVDLGQAPADLAVLSFSDSDLAGLAAAHTRADGGPEMRLAALRHLKHPMSVDLWTENTASGARAILVRVLGGYNWWSYGAERLSAMARKKGIALALLPGECSERDDELARLSTVPAEEIEALLGFFREGGPDNMDGLVARLSRLAGHDAPQREAVPVPRMGCYLPGEGIVDLPDAVAERPAVLVPFYRSLLLAEDIAPVHALAGALAARGMAAVPLFVPSLKGDDVAAFLARAVEAVKPEAIVTTTAFAAAGGGDGLPLFERLGVPVFQAALATTTRSAWAGSERGLTASDIAMHVVLPELDGRVMAGAISFKDDPAEDDASPLGWRAQRHTPEPSRIEAVADRVAALVRLRQTPAAERRLLVVMPDYPGADGRTGYAVGLDVPMSVLAMLHDLAAAGYAVDGIPAEPRDLMAMLRTPREVLPGSAWASAFAELPEAARAKVDAAWGQPDGAPLMLRCATFGNITVALAPDRGRASDRRADYHDPDLAPTHDLLAFGHFMRAPREAGGLEAHALVHVGAHGTLEWLPGKAVALGPDCFPQIVTGTVPVVYPFIVSNPGEAAQAKRRIAAVTLGHLPPPLVGAGLTDDEEALERLVDEYAQADGLDPARRDRLERVILDEAARTGLDRVAGVAPGGGPGEALKAIDGWLCDIKDFALKDGQHIYGRADVMAEDADPAETRARQASAEGERTALLVALAGNFVPPGPSGAPARGRADVHPTGRNLYTLDPRAMPTPTAATVGRASADEVVRYFMQEHGDFPARLVVDLWGSASLRTGGEEIAQGLALMGCRPRWDHASGRVTGVEVLPPALFGRPRVDVTFRVSGLFRDMFPAQVALLVAAADAVAARDEEEGDNPLAEAIARGEPAARVFSSAPGTYGSGAEALLQSGDWDNADEIGAAYLAAASHTLGADGDAKAAPGAFAARVAGAEGLVHTGDDPARDLLEGSADAAFIGGFAAAVTSLGGAADLVSLDTTDPARPQARSLSRALARTVRARAINPRYIRGQMRHGPRGASDLAETVDRLVGFAETTGAVSGELIGLLHEAYVEDREVRDFLLYQNPEAARAIAKRLADARRRGLWHPLRNSTDMALDMLAEAAGTALGITRREAAE
ncbi:cobaltochelatase subunit CobN [Acuticoccus sp. MNP-M23]|uniref:cobaltochelatase subunit CobN n=1 Tax=Acuticoccus sp. MNP-M23 TaxID=3072793 RepID=UPI002815405E|nr:cobaltochelatase subunit CobN [Acuticoccus sp. MNP-M23]WMS44308.1 cobaltochelatase subunit CobN [Acuticoccus sp. MNP-M23]